jgi:hypothetical protein
VFAAYADAAAAAAALPPPTGSAPNQEDWVFVSFLQAGPGEPPPASVVATARGAGARVHTVSLGPTPEQARLADLAARTGGVYHGVPVAAATDLQAFQRVAFEIANAIEGRQIVFEAQVPVGPAGTQTVTVPRAAMDLLLPTIKDLAVAATWTGAATSNDMAVTFSGGGSTAVRRDGSRYAAVHDAAPDPEDVYYDVTLTVGAAVAADTVWIQVAGHTRGGARLVTGIAHERGSGRSGPFYEFRPAHLSAAAYDDGGALEVRSLRAYITAPNASRWVRVLQPNTSPAHDDPAVDELVSWNWSTSLSRLFAFHLNALPFGEFDDGTYLVTTVADVARGAASGRIISRRAFHVAVPPGGSPDGDGDGLPDVVETAYACLDPLVPQPTASDDDNDGALTFIEFQRGTDPCDPDTDDGGELDGSEIDANADPLDADDDAVERVPFAIVDMSPPDHEDEGESNGRFHRIVAGRHSSHAVMDVRGGIQGQPETLLATITLQPGQGDLEYVHDNLVAGEQYCYRVFARNSAGRRAAPSPFACAIARNDSIVPWGSIVLQRGSPRTDDGQVRAYLGLYNENPATTQMQIEVDGVSARNFEPFASPVLLPYPVLSAPRRIAVAVRFRDEAGNMSPWYRDGLHVYPAGSLGEIRGRVLQAPVAGVAATGSTPMAGVWVELVGRASEMSAISASDGSFVLTDLTPGDYVVRAAHPGMNPAEIGPIALGPGDVVQLGDLTVSGADPLLVDGFE